MRSRTTQELYSRRIREGAAPKVSAAVAMVNLGCARNTVDSQNIIAGFQRRGHTLAPVENADVVVVNTCAFIEDAKKESIDTILALAELKKKGRIKKIIVAGCLAQRYGSELAGALKEVDAFIGVPSLPRETSQALPILTPAHYAYVKVCESCYNACSFCIIPRIKGPFVSRSMEAVVADVERLNGQSIREINIIGQDVTAYGMDLYGRKALAELLRKVAAVTQARWVRLLYTHPAHMSDELLDVIASETRLCKYIDMPLQHVSDRILKLMGRNMTHASTVALVKKIRAAVPGVFLRTTYIVGFPGETEADFERLLRFVKAQPFERVGVFMYSREEGTRAYDLPGQVPRAVARRRYKALMKAQQAVAAGIHQRLVGQELDVLIEERAPQDQLCYTGRSAFDAPEVDGAVHVHSAKPLPVGEFIRVRVTGAMEYDLEAEAL